MGMNVTSGLPRTVYAKCFLSVLVSFIDESLDRWQTVPYKVTAGMYECAEREGSLERSGLMSRDEDGVKIGG